MKDVNKIKSKLMDSIRAFNANIKRRREGRGSSSDDSAQDSEEARFSTTDFLFLSSRLAKKWPDLREAKIIAQFRTPWPKQSYQRETDVSKSYSKKFSALTRSASILAMFFLTNLIQVPPSVQDMLIHMVTTSAVGYTILLHVDLYKIFPVLVIVPLCVVALVVHFVIKSNRAASQRALDAALNGQPDKDAHSNSREGRSRLSQITPAYGEAAGEYPEDTGFIDEATNLDGELHTALEALPGLSTTPIILGATRKHITRRQSVQHGLKVLHDLQSKGRDADAVCAVDDVRALARDVAGAVLGPAHDSTIVQPPTDLRSYSDAESGSAADPSANRSDHAAQRRHGVGADPNNTVRTEVTRAVQAHEWDTELSLNSEQENEMEDMLADLSYDDTDSSDEGESDDLESGERAAAESEVTADTDDLIGHFIN
jgi:Ca2+/Na+ antiporter